MLTCDKKFSGFMHLAAGLSVGLTGLAAGYTIGKVGDKGVRAYMEEGRVFVGMVLILIFGEVLGLYGYGQPSTQTPRLALLFPSFMCSFYAGGELTCFSKRLIVALILNTKSKG